MTESFHIQAEPRIERLAIVESDALEDRIPLLVSSNQRLFAQGGAESLDEFSSRFVQRLGTLPPARVGLVMLGDHGDFEPRWAIMLALASRLQALDSAEIVISVRAGCPSEAVGWELLERASHEAFFRGIQLRLQFGPARALSPAVDEVARLRSRAEVSSDSLSA